MSQSRRGSNPGSSGNTFIILGPISTYSLPWLPRPPPFASVESPWSSFEETAPIALNPPRPAGAASGGARWTRETRAKAGDAHAEREAAAATRGRKARGADGGRVAEREEARAEMRTRPPTLEHDRDSREAAMVVIIARQACGRAPDPILTRHAVPSGWQVGAAGSWA